MSVKMEWLAVARRVPGNWTFNGLSISMPNIEDALNRMGARDEGHNVLIMPWPRYLGEALADRWPEAVKPVKGRLPALHLYPQRGGNNYEQWADYLAAHPARSTHASPEEFRTKPIALPKA